MIETRKLGKEPAQHRVGTRMFASYVASLDWLGTIPDVDWLSSLPPKTDVFANDQFGCCGFAGLANGRMTAASAAGQPFDDTRDTVLSWYSSCTGFRAADPSTDQGVVLIDALSWAVENEIIEGFLKVDHHNALHVRAAEYLFGGTYNGAMLPLSAQDTSSPWVGKTGALTGDDEPGSWGGHCMWRMGKFVTWGERQAADDQWRLNYQDEAYVLLLSQWTSVTRPAPNHFAMAELVADLARV